MLYVPVFRVHLVRESRQQVVTKDICTPEAAAAVLQEYLCGADRETFVVMGLTTKSRLIGLSTVSVGTLDACLVHPREVFKPAILMNAASVIVAHNHPSQVPEPSEEDWQITQRLVHAGTILGIDVLDHLVLSEDRHVSLKQTCQGHGVTGWEG